MSEKLVARRGINKLNLQVEYVGHCVVCKLGVYSNEAYGRAPKPLLGVAHGRCGGAQ